MKEEYVISIVYQVRHTYRIGWRRPANVVGAIILANVFVFLLELMEPRTFVMNFGLVPQLIRQKLYIWQFVTYMFLHGNFIHLFMNMLALYIFGHDLMLHWGHGRFLLYYFLTGIGAGICAFLFTDVPTIGASGAVYGLLLAYGVTFPNRIILLYFFVPMKAKYLVILFGIIELISTCAGYSDGIAHVAHLGGMVIGAILLFFFRWLELMKVPRRLDGWTIIPPHGENDEIDRILDKILKYGTNSLTKEERGKLVKAGKFFAEQYHMKKRDAQQ